MEAKTWIPAIVRIASIYPRSLVCLGTHRLRGSASSWAGGASNAMGSRAEAWEPELNFWTCVPLALPMFPLDTFVNATLAEPVAHDSRNESAG